MTFSSLTFLFVFFPVTFLLYALIRNHTARNFILAAASLVFYAFGEPVAVMIMLISIVLNYELIGDGYIPGMKIGNAYRIPKINVIRYALSAGNPQPVA